MKSSTGVIYLVYVLLWNFKKDYKMCQMHNEHSLVAFLSVEIETSEDMRDTNIRRPREYVYGCSMSELLAVQDLVLMMSGTKGKKRSIFTLHLILRMVLDHPESSHMAVFRTTMNTNVN